MSPNVITRGTNGLVVRALFAAVLLLFAAVIAPICALTIACAMPCCEGTAFRLVQSAAGAACAGHCGISSSAASQELPEAVAPSSRTPLVALAALGVPEAADGIVPNPPPRLPVSSVESRHAVPGDAPVYLYNSAFLI